MKMDAPQIVWVVLSAWNLLTHLVNHGRKKEVETYDANKAMFHTLLVLGFLYWGGFFS
jgi:hypothetical protein